MLLANSVLFVEAHVKAHQFVLALAKALLFPSVDVIQVPLLHTFESAVDRCLRLCLLCVLGLKKGLFDALLTVEVENRELV